MASLSPVLVPVDGRGGGDLDGGGAFLNLARYDDDETRCTRISETYLLFNDDTVGSLGVAMAGGAGGISPAGGGGGSSSSDVSSSSSSTKLFLLEFFELFEASSVLLLLLLLFLFCDRP